MATTWTPDKDILPLHCQSRPELEAMLKVLKHPDYPNMLHIHEHEEGGQAVGEHTLDDCEQGGISLTLSKPRLFSGTYIKDGQTILAYGYVAAKLP